jgi:hypothetical protein
VVKKKLDEAALKVAKNDEIWINNITRREKALVEKAGNKHWDRYNNEFQGDYSELMGGVDNRVVANNLIYSYVRSEVPNLYLQDPYFEFTPRQETTIGVAKLKEMAVNDIWDRKKFRREVKKVVQDAKIIGHGWAKVGYNAEIGVIEDGKTVNEFISKEDFFFYRVNPKHILFNDESVDAPHDSTWIAHKFFIQLDAARENKTYNAKRSKLNGVKLAGNLEKTEQKSASVFTTGDLEFAELYEVWDIKNQKTLIVSKQKDVGILHEKKWPYTKMTGFPFLYLGLSPVNDDPYPISDVGMGERYVLEKAKIRSSFLEHLKRGNRQVVTKTNNLNPEMKDAWARGDDTVLLEAEDPTAFAAIPYAAFQPDVYGLESRLDDDLAQIWGQRPNDRAGQARTQTRTKFELEEQGVGSTNRLVDQQNTVADFVIEAAEKFSCMLEQYGTEPFYVRITGYPHAKVAEFLKNRPSAGAKGAVTSEYGFTATNKDIQGPCDVKIRQGTAVPLDTKGKLGVIEKILTLGPTAGAAPGGPLMAAAAKMLVEMSGLHELTIAMEAEAEVQKQQSAKQQAETTEQASIAAANQATKLQLEAQRIAIEQSKVDNKMLTDLAQMVNDMKMKLAELEGKATEKSDGK